MQGRQWIELTLDRPIGANDAVGAVHQPDAHHPLEQITPQLPVGKRQALGDKPLSQGFFFFCFVHNRRMNFRTILALITAVMGTGIAQAGPGAAQAQTPVRGDDQILEMNLAFRQGNRQKLTQLLPAVRGHALEPWAAYWELKARLESATEKEVQEFFSRYPGTYQEDRLRNDWLL